MTTCGKITFTPKEAADALSHMRREGILTGEQGSTYYCGLCDGQHVTSMTKRQARAYRLRRRVLAEEREITL